MRQVNNTITVAASNIALLGVGPQPQLAGYTHTNAGYQSVVISGNYAYVLGTGGDSTGVIGLTLTIFNVANPAVPTLLTTYTLPAGTKPAEVVVSNGYAYVSDLNTSTVQIINISNPLIPVYMASMHASNNFNVTNSASISGNYAYITSGPNATYGGSIDFFDITNKSSPVLVKTVQEGVPGSLFTGSTLHNNLLYVADYGVSPSYSASLKIYSTQLSFSTMMPATNLLNVSVQADASSSTSKGSLTLQGSDDIAGSDGNPGIPTNWNDITTAIPISGSGAYLIPMTDICYQNIRLAFVNTGSTGLTATVKGLGY